MNSEGVVEVVRLAVDDKLGDRVGVRVDTHAARDLLVLHQRQEQRHEFVAVGRRNCLQHLGHEIPAGRQNRYN